MRVYIVILLGLGTSKVFVRERERLYILNDILTVCQE